MISYLRQIDIFLKICSTCCLVTVLSTKQCFEKKKYIFNLIHQKWSLLHISIPQGNVGTNTFQFINNAQPSSIPPKNPPVAQPKHTTTWADHLKSEMTADSVSNPAKENIQCTTQWHLITMQHVVHMPRNHVCNDRRSNNFLPINYKNCWRGCGCSGGGVNDVHAK